MFYPFSAFPSFAGGFWTDICGCKGPSWASKHPSLKWIQQSAFSIRPWGMDAPRIQSAQMDARAHCLRWNSEYIIAASLAANMHHVLTSPTQKVLCIENWDLVHSSFNSIPRNSYCRQKAILLLSISLRDHPFSQNLRHCCESLDPHLFREIMTCSPRRQFNTRLKGYYEHHQQNLAPWGWLLNIS